MSNRKIPDHKAIFGFSLKKRRQFLGEVPQLPQDLAISCRKDWLSFSLDLEASGCFFSPIKQGHFYLKSA